MIEFLILFAVILALVWRAPMNVNDYKHTTYIFGAIAFALAAIGTGISISEQRQAQRRQRGAQQEQARRQRAADLRRRREAIREARVRRARSAQQIENAGVGGSSVAAGALGSIQSQLGSNLGFQSSQAASVQRQSILQQKAAGDLSTAATGQGIANLGTFGLQNEDRIKSIFE